REPGEGAAHALAQKIEGDTLAVDEDVRCMLADGDLEGDLAVEDLGEGASDLVEHALPGGGEALELLPAFGRNAVSVRFAERLGDLLVEVDEELAEVSTGGLDGAEGECSFERMCFDLGRALGGDDRRRLVPCIGKRGLCCPPRSVGAVPSAVRGVAPPL